MAEIYQPNAVIICSDSAIKGVRMLLVLAVALLLSQVADDDTTAALTHIYSNCVTKRTGEQIGLNAPTEDAIFIGFYRCRSERSAVLNGLADRLRGGGFGAGGAARSASRLIAKIDDQIRVNLQTAALQMQLEDMREKRAQR